jgi:two-component system, OmpR family, KDP operon response regulator KdpE
MKEANLDKKILVVDDDPTFVKLIEQVLSVKGFKVIKAYNGKEALRLLFEEKPDLVLLDVVMPEMDGWQTCVRIRDISDVPIIFLTGAQKTESDVVRGLDYGADEYIVKPVGNRELVARVQAVLRRTETPSGQDPREKSSFSDSYLTISVTERKVFVNGQRVKLTPIEFRLLAYLLENANHILTHRQLLEKVWGWEYTDDVDYVRIYISHLRQKIEREPANPKYIVTEPGVGYFFQKQEKAESKTIDAKSEEK